jgi:anti-anti-sigma factor
MDADDARGRQVAPVMGDDFDFTVVIVRGRLDLGTVAGLRGRLLRVSHRPGSLLLVDLAGVVSCDVLGLGVLIAAARRARCHGSELRLVAPSPAVVKASRASGLSRVLPVLSDLQAALGAVVADGNGAKVGAAA